MESGWAIEGGWAMESGWAIEGGWAIESGWAIEGGPDIATESGTVGAMARAAAMEAGDVGSSAAS